MTEPSAKVIADSMSPDGHRLTTMEVVMHRFVLAEANTHRVFSRNSASSRAIPLKKQLERGIKDPAIPVVWATEQKGMQGGEPLDDDAAAEAERFWLEARDDAVMSAKALAHIGVHKSIVNRLLEPFMWHTVIVSSTEWDNFFRQRCSPLAQPEIRVAAEAMRAALAESVFQCVPYGEWHLPYIRHDEQDEFPLDQLRKLSVARCARVSYLTHDGVRDPAADLALYDRLVTADPMHASPLEHVAHPASGRSTKGNFEGWEQLRHMVETR